MEDIWRRATAPGVSGLTERVILSFCGLQHWRTRAADTGGSGPVKSPSEPPTGFADSIDFDDSVEFGTKELHTMSLDRLGYL